MPIEVAGATALMLLAALAKTAALWAPGELEVLAGLRVWAVTLELRMVRRVWITPSRGEWRFAENWVAATDERGAATRRTWRRLSREIPPASTQ